MGATEDTAFARLVSLAVHDLRTPLATISGFARTLTRMQDLADPLARYLAMIETASDQLAELLNDLGVAARIEGKRYEPALVEANTLALARDAAARVRDATVDVRGEGASVRVDVDAIERALYNFARCAIRHGGLERLDIDVARDEIVLTPIDEHAAPVIVARELRDLGAAVALRVVDAAGGSSELAGEAFRIRLPRAVSD